MRKPRILFGFVASSLLRWNATAGDYEKLTAQGGFQFNRAPEGGWAASSIQKQSRAGICFWWPLMFNCWLFWRPQSPGVPGSERGVYIRLGLFRYDFATQSYMTGRRAIFIGGHWD